MPFQLFGIGFLLTFAGPCLLTCCVPAAILCAAGSSGKFRKTFESALLFLSGRLFSTLIYGVLAGLSVRAISLFRDRYGDTVRISTALFFIAAALLILTGEGRVLRCRTFIKKSGFLLMGAVMGLLPCPPFIAVFMQIALISAGVKEALLNSLFFAIGIFLSGLIVICACGGAMGRAAAEIIKLPKVHLAARILCALFFLLIALGYFLR
ncbi:MAG: sulfite exporter TauE/SafE family protein [Candidatus Omnitrophota bacterium]|nr:sulfite exporter TauE/SafE family protein [bacterium]MBU4122971.1 sulfite exporter TauE/SafE family protein [bacterium]